MKLSKNFNLREFICPCCGKSNIAPELIIKLQQLRDEIGEPIYVTSGVRCAGYNKKIDGYSNSPHIEGLAADCYTTGIDLITFAREAEKIGFSRIGLYNNFLHLDIVLPHPSTSWVRQNNGKYKYFLTLEEAIKFKGGI